MKLPMREIPFRLLTPCFSGGASPENSAELRVPSIRGQVRFWHGQRFDAASVARVWGALGDHPTASQIAVTATPKLATLLTNSKPLLPHANPNSNNAAERAKGRSERDALLPADFRLTLRWLPSQPPATEGRTPAQDWQDAQTAVRLWLLIGALGLRSNRAAGSVWPGNAPADASALAKELQTLRCPWTVWIGKPRLPQTEATLEARCEALRVIASDTPAGHQEVFGDITPKRKPSPVRFKVAAFGEVPALLMLARHPDLLPEAKILLLSHRAGRLDWQPLFPSAANTAQDLPNVS